MKRIMMMIIIIAIFCLIHTMIQADTFIDPDVDDSGCGIAMRYKGYQERVSVVCGYTFHDKEIWSYKVSKCAQTHLMNDDQVENYIKEGASDFDSRYSKIGNDACIEQIKFIFLYN
jgi:hypothetical protein